MNMFRNIAIFEQWAGQDRFADIYYASSVHNALGNNVVGLNLVNKTLQIALTLDDRYVVFLPLQQVSVGQLSKYVQ